MDTAKPSNPSGKVGEADDLIEEMARMMAAGAKEKTAAAQARGNSGLSPASPGARPAGNSPAAGAGQGTVSPTLERAPVQQNEPAPQTPPPASQAPTGTGQGAPTSPVPFARQETAAPGASGTTEKSAFKFELGGAGTGPGGGSAGQAPEPAPGLTPQPPQPQGAQASSPQSPQLQAQASAPGQAAPSSGPDAFGGAAASEPLNDPIADLIRAQSQPAPQKISAPEPPARPAQRGSLQAESEANSAPDDFSVPPVFGLGGKPSEPAPPFPTPAPPPQASPPKSDALDEIEHLIGNAVHVDFPEDSSAQKAVESPQTAPAPSVSPHVSAQPQAASIVPPPAQPANNVDAAEAAILQAMAATSPGKASLPDDATGPEALKGPGQVQPEEALLAGAAYTAEKPSAIKRYLVPAVAVLVLVSAGIAGYFMLNSGGTDGDAPLLLADGSPTKETPAPRQTGGEDQSVVFNGIEGNSVPDSEQRLVSRDQTDGATGNEVRQVITVDNTEAGLANRRVRTVTVRPDGTIISGDDAVAGSEVLPVAQPNLPELPAGAVNTELAGTTVAALPASPNLTGTASDTTPGGSANLATFAVDGSNVPFPEARLTDLERQSRLAVTSVPRSGTQNSSGPGTVDLIASLASEAVAPPPANIPPTTQPLATAQPLQPVTNATNFVQLASLRDQGVAQDTAANMQARYASALRGGRLEVRRVDLGDRGVFYRVLLPTASFNEASSVCNAIQNAGGDCFPRNN